MDTDKRALVTEPGDGTRLLDVLIRASLILGLALLCYRVFAPFLTLMAWALILAIALYPLHRLVARKIGGRQGLAATLVVLLGCVLIVLPTAILMSSLGDSIERLVHGVQANTIEIPAPPDSIATWPFIGKKLHAAWSQAHSDLPSLVRSLQPKIGNLARAALAFVASIGVGLLQFLASFIIAGILMAFGRAGDRSMQAIFERVAGIEHGPEFARLATATIRAVAQGVIGVAFIQAIVIGLCLQVASVPGAGVLTVVALVLGIAQVPAFVVTLPAIAYIWLQGEQGNAAAIGYTVVLFVAGMLDNVLKPLMIGRGVDAPMPVILLGALGGMASGGIVGMFVGATALALGYQIFMGWVAVRRGPDKPSGDSSAPTATSVPAAMPFDG
jgi:predicted PurR-regulated permease PerM